MADAIRPPLLRLGTALSLQCWAPSRDLTFSLGGLDRLCAARREFKVHVRHQERVLRRQTGARGKVYRGAQISSCTRAFLIGVWTRKFCLLGPGDKVDRLEKGRACG